MPTVRPSFVAGSHPNRPDRPDHPARPVLVLPGYGGSGPGHWQTLWERAHPHFRRVEAADWEHPVKAEWVDNLEAAVRESGPDTVLVAHSLACLQVVHWAAATVVTGRPTVRAALLVAPPDPEAPAFPVAATGFSPLPKGRLPFLSMLVASTDDPYATATFSEGCARAWGSHFVSIGPAGHINAASGLGAWEDGKRLLESLLG